jgi:hypothetical protein
MNVPYVMAASAVQQSINPDEVANVEAVTAVKVQQLYPIDLESFMDYEEVCTRTCLVSALDDMGAFRKSMFVDWTVGTNFIFAVMDIIIVSECKDEKTKTYVSIDLLCLVLISLFLIFMFETKKNNNSIVIQTFRCLFLGTLIFYSSTIISLPKNQYINYFFAHSVYSLCFFLYFFGLSLFFVERSQ